VSLGNHSYMTLPQSLTKNSLQSSFAIMLYNNLFWSLQFIVAELLVVGFLYCNQINKVAITNLITKYFNYILQHIITMGYVLWCAIKYLHNN
jgi:type IV secretory pathway TrbL component